jgi:hypothetical protein
MLEQARAAGANAIVNVRFWTSNIAAGGKRARACKNTRAASAPCASSTWGSRRLRCAKNGAGCGRRSRPSRPRTALLPAAPPDSNAAGAIARGAEQRTGYGSVT